MRKMLMLLGFPNNRIIVEDRANSTVQNAQFSVPLAKQAGTSGISLVTSPVSLVRRRCSGHDHRSWQRPGKLTNLTVPPTALLRCVPFWFCQCDQWSATRKAPACAGSSTWWHTRSPASGTLSEWVLAAIRGPPTVPRINNDPELISQALQQFYNGKVSPTYSEPSTPWHNGHTKSFNNRGYARSA